MSYLVFPHMISFVAYFLIKFCCTLIYCWVDAWLDFLVLFDFRSFLQFLLWCCTETSEMFSFFSFFVLLIFSFIINVSILFSFAFSIFFLIHTIEVMSPLKVSNFWQNYRLSKLGLLYLLDLSMNLEYFHIFLPLEQFLIFNEVFLILSEIS